MTKQSLLTLGTIVAAFAVGRLLASEPAAQPAPPPPPQVAMAPLSGATSAEIRAAIRSELQRELPTIVTARAPVEEEPAPEVIEQRARAAERGRALVSSAVGAGRWTGSDARALLEILPQITPEQHDEIMSALIVPVNQGRIKVETAGSLLDPT